MSQNYAERLRPLVFKKYFILSKLTAAIISVYIDLRIEIRLFNWILKKKKGKNTAPL